MGNKKKNQEKVISHTTLATFEEYFDKLNIGLKFNLLTQVIFISFDREKTWVQIHPAHEGEIESKLRELRLTAFTTGEELPSNDVTKDGYVRKCTISLAYRRAFNPVEDYLNACLQKYKTTPGDDLFKFLASIKCSEMCEPNKEKFFTRWMMGAILTVFQEIPDFQNELLIITGPQGIGKSTLFRKLGSGLREYFYTGMPQPGNKDSLINLARTFIWCWDELQAGAKGASIDRDALKDFLTTDYIKVRTAYERHPIRQKRIAAMCGTTNEKEILTDSTGERRKSVLEVDYIDFEMLNSVDVDLLWGCVYQLLIDHSHKPLSIKAEQAASNKRFYKYTLLESKLHEYFTFEDPGYAIKSSLITDFLAEKGAFNNSEAAWTQLNNVLTKLGCVKKSTKIGGHNGQGLNCWHGIRWREPGGLRVHAREVR